MDFFPVPSWEWLEGCTLLGLIHLGVNMAAHPTWRPPQHGSQTNWINYVVTAWLRASPKRLKRKLHGLLT